MSDLVKRTAFLLAVCVAFSWAVYYLINMYSFALSFILWPFLLRSVIYDWGAELHHAVKRVHLEPLSGTHFAYHDMTVNALEDHEHSYWIPVADVKKIVGRCANDRALELTYPGGWEMLGKPPKGHLRDDALVLYLAKEQELRGIQFKVWVERNIAFPANRKRERFGIRLNDPQIKKADDDA